MLIKGVSKKVETQHPGWPGSLSMSPSVASLPVPPSKPGLAAASQLLPYKAM